MSFKKIVKSPEESPPELLRESSAVVQERKIPASVLYNSSLKKMSGFRNLRASMKRDAFLKEFIVQGLQVFEPYEVNDDTQYDSEIVKFMCQTAEDIFIKYHKQGEEKKRAVIEVCKKYFDGNEVLTGKMVEQVLPSIIKSSFLRRNRTRIYNLGLFFLGLFLTKPNRA